VITNFLTAVSKLILLLPYDFILNHIVFYPSTKFRQFLFKNNPPTTTLNKNGIHNLLLCNVALYLHHSQLANGSWIFTVFGFKCIVKFHFFLYSYLSGKVVTAGHPLNWSTMTRKCRPSTSPMSVWMISNGLVAGCCFFSGSAGSDGSWLTHFSHDDAALVISTSMFGQ
jgi:hypothetical protein